SLDNGSSTGIFVGKILNEANINANRAFAFVDGEEKQKALRICPEGVAHSASRSSCPITFPNSEAASRASTLPPEAYIPKRDLTMVPVFVAGNLTSFMMLDTANPEEIISLSATCVQTLTWPYQQ
ncbi:6624_t:CDS:1, partial [Acaulospora colombiana]